MNTKSTLGLFSWRNALLGLATLGLSASAAQAQTVYGLSITSSFAVASLVTFDAATPGTFTATVPITGFAAGQAIVGIDVRPNTGELFTLGYNPTSTQAQLYTVSPTTGVVTAVGAALTLNLGATTSRIGFDFNPTVDRIRVTAANNTNFRLNPNNGALAATDGTLAYATTDANAGQTPGVGSSAYTNSYIGASATTLYNLDEANSRLVTQSPPNNGTLNTVGPLGVATDAISQASDLDIYFNATSGANVAYMTTAVSTSASTATSTLYTVNLSTGAATAVGALGTGPLVAITDITFAISRPATLPTVTGQLVYALSGTNLITFDTASPTLIRTSVALTGFDGSRPPVGLDVRPLTNTLYALGYNPAAPAGLVNTLVYSINANTGATVSVGSAIRLELGTGSIGFDFNPTVDRIRVVGANGNNYRLNPLTGALAATDAPVSYPTGTSTPSIGAVAYTNSFMGASSTSGTTLYSYDEVLNTLNTQNTAAGTATDGQLTTVGASGITANAAAPNVDLDIYSTGVGVNTAYMVANTGTSANTSLYTVDLTTGAATLVGAIGNGLTARDIAVAAATGVVTANRPAELATNFSLYPNPLSGVASLAFGLPRAAHVQLTVTDILGRTIDEVNAGLLPAGPQTIRWNRKSQMAGTYFFRLSFDGKPAGTRQVLLTE